MHRLLALLLVTTLAACGGDTTDDLATGEPGVRVVTVEEAVDLLAAESAPTVVDVRTPEEYAEGHLEGALLVDYNAPGFRDEVAELDPTGTYVIYCRSGNRSAGAREVMTELGFTDVADIDGGIRSWLDAGRPVVAE